MKKILVIGAITSAVICTSLNAAQSSKAGMDFSMGAIAFDKSNSQGSVGFDIDWQKRIVGDLYIGAGINTEIYKSKYPEGIHTTQTDSDLGIILDVYPIISYNFTNKLSINALYAYTVGELGSETYDGTTYGFGAEYKFSKNWATSVNYKMSELEFTSYAANKIDTERYNATISYKF